MLRAILGAVVGYIVMVAVVMAGIAGTWFGLGNRFAFEGDTNLASLGWTGIMLGAGFVAAFIGGVVAIKTAGPAARTAILILLAMLLILGALSAYQSITMQPTSLPEGKTIDDLTFMEAGQYARSPNWYHLAIVVVGIFGVLLALAQQLPSILGADKRSASQG